MIDVVPADETTEETTDEDPTEGVTEDDAGLGNTLTEVAAEEEPNDGKTAEDAGLGNTSTETAAVVEPTEQTVEKEEKAAGGDIVDYVGKDKLTVKLYKEKYNDAGDLISSVEVGKNSENEYDVNPSDNPFKLLFRFENVTFAPGTYTHQLPSKIKYEMDPNQTPEIKFGDDTIATFSVTEGGLLKVVFNENANNHQNETISIGFNVNFGGENHSLVTIDDVPIRIDYKRAGEPKIEKKSTGRSGSTLKWSIDVTCDEEANAVGLTVMDRVGSAHSHKFNTDQTFTVTAKDANGNKKAQWTIGTGTVGFTWVKNEDGNYYGWNYTIPNKAPSDATEGAGVQFGLGWDFSITSVRTTATITPEDAGRSVRYYNYAYLYDDDTKIGDISSNRLWSIGGASIRKAGKYVSKDGSTGTKDYMEWTVTVSDIKPDEWEPEDRLVIGDYLRGSQYKGNSTTETTSFAIGKEIVPEWENLRIDITLADGKIEENVPIYKWDEGAGAGAGGASASGYWFRYIDVKHKDTSSYYGSPYGWLYLYNVNSEGSSVSNVSKIVVTYRQKVTTELLELLDTKDALNIYNTGCWAKNNYIVDSYIARLPYKDSGKKIESIATKDNKYQVTFAIDYTPSDADISKYESIIITDEMSDTMSMIRESLSVTATGVDGYVHDVKYNDKDFYDNHKLHLQIYDPDLYTYHITYKCTVSNDPNDANASGDIDYWNKFQADVDGEIVATDETGATLSNYDGEAHRYTIRVNKVDEKGAALKGAVIEIFTADDALFKAKTTGEDGIAEFSTNVKEDIVFKQNSPYYIQETKAPQGYQKDGKKYWFVISEKGFDGYQEDSYWENYFGDKNYTIIKPTSSGSSGSTSATAEFEIVNKLENTEIPVEKVWNDNKTQHDSVTVELYAGGEKPVKTMVLNEENSFKGKFTDLQKTDASGNAIVYTVKEVTVAGYKSVVTGSAAEGFKITNTPIANIAVEKIWNDVNNEAGKRPASLKVYLTKNGSRMTGKDYSVTLNETGGWKHTWPNLPLTDEDGNEITYSVEEDEVTGYTAGNPVKKSETTDEQTGVTTVTYTITNTYVPKTEISVKKVWNDANNQDGKRPASISVFLTKDGKQVGTPILLDGKVDETETTAWEYTWTNLDKYSSDGTLINYGVDEDDTNMPEGYSKSVTSVGTVYTITNTYAPGKVNAQVTKVWEDADNQDGLRKPVEVQLMKNGESMGDAYKATLTKDNWTKTWTGLDEKKDGVQIKYTVVENTKLAGYDDPEIESVYNAKTKTWEISVTNEHTPVTTKINVAKVWNDNNDQDGKRPASINVYLTKDGTKDESTKQTLSEANGWTYTWDNLPLNKKEGQEIAYSVTEDVIADYNDGKAAEPVKVKEETDSTGIKTVYYSLTNAHGPEVTKVYVEKEWADKGDQDGKRPAKIKVNLIDSDNPGTVIESTELSEAKGWSYTFANLPKYKKTAAGSVEITYDVTETVEGKDSLDDYVLTKTEIAKEDLPEGGTGVGFAYHLKNTYEPEKRNIDVKKVWKDDDNMDQKRPAEITVQLYADGAKFGDPVTLKKSEGWTHTWEGLDKYKDGKEITYTVDEVEVPDGYKKVSIGGGMTTGYIITNKHDERPVSISKVDITNSEEVADATLQVLDKDGNVVEEWTSEDNGEPHVVYGLTPGVEYTLREKIQPDGYTIAADTTFTIIVDEKGVFQKVESTGTVLKDSNVVLVEDAPIFVKVKKVDATSQKEVAGAHIQILDGEKIFDEWDSEEGVTHEVKYLVADKTYVLHETVAPLGYTVASDTEFSVNNKNEVTYKGETVSLKEDGVPVILVEDTMTTVSISKTDITGEKELKDATLQILDEDENVVTVKDRDGNDVKCEWISTDEPHVVEGLPTGKTYILRETISPDGYTIATDATFSIDENNEITYSGKKNDNGVLLVEDEPTKVKISKVDITGEKELQGATLQILDAEGNVVEIKNNDGEVVEKCEWVSTKEPKYIEGLKTETVYTLRETIAPDGYTIATEFQFTIATDGTVTSEGKTIKAEDTEDGVEILLVEDAPTKVYISKTDITNDKELPGAKLQILDEDEKVVVLKDNDGNPVETLEWVSGEEPKYIEGLPTGKNYILRETISPDGYSIASDTKFTIDEKGVVTSTGTTSKAEDGTTVLVVEDDLTTVQISKVDTESGAELEGAKIQIIDEKGKVVEEWISTKEVHIVRGLVAGKKYILREQVAPLGYTLTSDTTFSIDMHNVVTSTGPVNKDGVILVNDTMTEIEILKVDSKTGKGLKGAKLQVLDDNGKVCEEWTSTKDAHKIKGLYTGVKYTLHEVEAPKGYDKAKDITFTIDTAGKVSSDALENGVVVMKDTPTPSKSKNKTGDEANGALWALLLLMAGGALGGTVWFKRKKRA